jgi:hypothetical protein
MKSGWYGDWETVTNIDADSPRYVEMMVRAIKLRIIELMKAQGAHDFIVENEHAIIRKNVGLNLSNPSETVSTIGYKAHFKFKDPNEPD